jgi:DUF4097 and DUF4098 domain-containing protein YvlB
MRYLLLPLLLISSCAFVINGRVRAEHEDNFTFASQDINMVKVETYNGRVELSTGAARETLCRAKFYATGHTLEEATENVNMMKVVSSVEGDTLTISVPRHSKLGTNNVGASLYLTLPEGVEIDIYTANGSVESTDAFPSPKVRTSNGAITMIASSGPVELRTSNGRINLTNETGGDVEAKTSNGPIFYSGTSRDMELLTSNGSIEVVLPNGWDGQSYFETRNGNIKIHCDGTLDCSLSGHTSNGKIRVNGPRLNEVGASDAHIRVDTSNGSVTVEHGSGN